jgi:hypothetical protein
MRLLTLALSAFLATSCVSLFSGSQDSKLAHCADLLTSKKYMPLVEGCAITPFQLIESSSKTHYAVTFSTICPATVSVFLLVPEDAKKDIEDIAAMESHWRKAERCNLDDMTSNLPIPHQLFILSAAKPAAPGVLN